MENRRHFRPIPNLWCRLGELRKDEFLDGLSQRILTATDCEIPEKELAHLKRGQLKWIHLCLLRKRLFIPRVYEEIRVAKEKMAGETLTLQRVSSQVRAIRMMRARRTRELALDRGELPF